MSVTLPARPAPAARPWPSRAGPPAPPPRRERRAARSAWLVGFTLSVALHLVLLFSARFDLLPRSGDVTRSAPVTVVRPAVGTHVDRIVVLPDGQVPDPQLLPRPQVRYDAAPALPTLPAVRGAPAARPDAARPAARTFRERLMPDERDAQVWMPPSPINAPLDAEAAARARLAGKLDAYNDSVALAAASAARAVDWTKTDANGGRWGVSPEGIHLGDITIPVPVNFSAGPGRRDEAAGRVRDWGEIQSQAGRAEGRETFEERVRAIRERKERERREGQPPPQ
jgi:hypothetical protein